MSAYKDENTKKKIIKSFCGQVHYLRIVRHMYRELFETEKSYVLMEKVAPSFFAHLNTILHNYLLLEFAKISDPAKSFGNENFTVDNLLLCIDWPQDIKKRLESQNNIIKEFRDYIQKARHKLLAHSDKETFLKQKHLGDFPEGKDENFLKALEEICNITHEACFGNIYGSMVVTQAGDVISFKKMLFNGLAFDKLLEKSDKKQKVNMYSVLDEVRKS
jgi:hypothetical protein